MKMTKLIAFTASISFTALLSMSGAGNGVVMPEHFFPKLDAILIKAVQQSPRMLSTALDLEMAENNRIAAQSGMLPSISGYYSYQKSRDKSEYLYNIPGQTDSIDTYTLTKTPYAVSLSQPLFHWGSLRDNAKIGEIQKNIAQGQYREAYRALAQSIRSEYLRLVLMKMGVKRDKFYQQLAMVQLKQEEERLAKKVISEAEIFGIRINTERAIVGAERAEFNLKNAIKSFARTAGLGDEFTEADIPDSIPTISADVNGLQPRLAGFLAQKDPNNSEAENLRQRLEVEKLTYASNRSRLWPKLSFVAGFTQSEDDNYFGSGARYSVTSQYAGLNVNWSIFDGFATRSYVRNSLIRRRQLEDSYRQLNDRLAEDAQNQVGLVDFSARYMSLADRMLASGEGNVRAAQEEFQRGVRSEASVDQTKLALIDAQVNAYNARRDYLLSIGDFLGTIREDPVLANVSDK